MDRRNFIRLVGGGVVIAATAPVAGCAPAGPDPRAAWDNPGAGESDIRRKALSFAILAPNPHNMQPWIVDLRTADEITLFVDRTRLLPVTDPFNRQIVIGCGGFLELLTMALAAQGVSASVAMFPDGQPRPVLDDRPIFRLRLDRATAPERSPLFDQALERRTNRGAFADAPVAEADLRAIVAAARLAPGVGTTGTVEPARVERLRRLVYEGARIEAHTPAAHHESVERTFIGARDVAAHPWGISLDQPAMTAMNAVGLLTRAKMATPGTTAFAEALKFLKTAADTSQGFVWVVTDADSRIDQLAAGRVYLRANLAATARGLAMHPWSQGLQEYATQKPVYEALHKALAPDGGRIQMLARIGHPKVRPGPSPRRGLAAQIRSA
jgi:nitroreductase